MDNVKLNFLPLIDQDYRFLIYRKKVENGSSPKEEIFYRAKLPVSDTSEDWALYDISFEFHPDCEEMQCGYLINGSLSEEYLYKKVKAHLLNNVQKIEHRISDN